MRYIEENLGEDQTPSGGSFSRRRLEELQERVAQLAETYQEFGLLPHLAWRSALADFAGDFPSEVAVLVEIRRGN